MPRRLIYAQEARDDLAAARGWLTQAGSGPAARRKLAAIRADIRWLQQQPCLWPAGDHPSVRELSAARGYRVLYKVEPDTGRNETAGDVVVLRRPWPRPPPTVTALPLTANPACRAACATAGCPSGEIRRRSMSLISEIRPQATEDAQPAPHNKRRARNILLTIRA